MRSHGVSNFPDPTISSSGNHASVGLAIPSGLTQSPAFKPAQQACAKLQPGPAGPSGAATDNPDEQAQLVKFAACMRSHGVPDFPDPSQGGAFNLPSEVNQNAPQFQTTIRNCAGNGLSLSINQGSGPQ
jgi:hypothetical protein